MGMALQKLKVRPDSGEHNFIYSDNSVLLFGVYINILCFVCTEALNNLLAKEISLNVFTHVSIFHFISGSVAYKPQVIRGDL